MAGLNAFQDSINIIRLPNKQIPNVLVSKSVLQLKPTPQHNPIPIKSAIEHSKHITAPTNVLHRLDPKIKPRLLNGKISTSKINET